MKRVLSYFVVFVLIAVVAGFVGANQLSMQANYEERIASYTKTEFDYIINSPTTDQIKEYRENKEAVSGIFPVSNFELNVSGKKTAEINLFVSNQIDFYNVGLFNDDLIKSGKYVEGQLLIDSVAADMLGVTTGDDVSFTIYGKTYNVKVCAVYYRCNYATFTNGLAMFEEPEGFRTQELESYSLAFVSANDETKCSQLMDEYVPLGQMTPGDDYEDFISKPHPNAVQNKQEMFTQNSSGILAEMDKLNNKVLVIGIGLAIGLVVALAIVGLVFAKMDLEQLKSGYSKKQMILTDIISIAVITIIVAVVLLIILNFVAGTLIASTTYTSIINKLWLPILISLVLTLPIAIFRVQFISNKGNINKSSNMYNFDNKNR